MSNLGTDWKPNEKAFPSGPESISSIRTAVSLRAVHSPVRKTCPGSMTQAPSEARSAVLGIQVGRVVHPLFFGLFMAVQDVNGILEISRHRRKVLAAEEGVGRERGPEIPGGRGGQPVLQVAAPDPFVAGRLGPCFDEPVRSGEFPQGRDDQVLDLAYRTLGGHVELPDRDHFGHTRTRCGTGPIPRAERHPRCPRRRAYSPREATMSSRV